ncbi:MAG TPA: ABC transporter permease subunit [Burkholderiales bacterium]|nr:ABC transporter permease subunit [Burkholderiales bacterium]
MKKSLLQGVALAAVLALGWYLYSNTVANLAERNIATGFGFLRRESGFEIGESLIAYGAADTYLRALVVGLLNTFQVAGAGIAAATVLGFVVGLSALSPNLLLRALARVYVEFFRNTPLLVQLFFWYALITEALPSPREALSPVSGLFLSNRGIFFPLPGNVPVLEGFNFLGGAHLSPELAALLAGLVVYTAAFIGEIVRAGIQAVPRGQVDAGYAIGLRRPQALRRVVLPQALRMIVPPLTSQYLNLTKNSSLAVAIGYPDFVSVVNTTLNQTGQAIEGIALIMAAYLTASLAISAFMNWYNARIQLK